MKLFLFLFFLFQPLYAFKSSWINGYEIPREDVFGRKWKDFRPYAPPMSLESDVLKLKKDELIEIALKVKKVENINSIRGRFHYNDDSIEFREIAYYADLNMNLIQEDEWVKMTFAPNFYADKKLKMFSLLFDFKKDFSEDFRISIQPLKKIKKKNKSAIITLTFDDGTKDHLKVASYLHKNGLKGTFFIIPKYRDRVEFLNLKELNEIHKLKMELAYHHYNPITDMYFQNLGKNLKDDFLETKKILPSIKPHFAYPLGKFDLYGRYEFIKNNFKSGRIVGGGPETIPPGNKYLLRSVNITSQTKVEELIAIVKNCIKSQTWGIFMFHKLKEENPEGLVEYSMSDFKKFVEFLKNEKINVKTIGEVISNLK